MKRTDMTKADAERIRNQMNAKNATYGTGASGPDRREQRERDRALGLVPFACKLNGELVKQLQEVAKERGVDMNQLVAELLQKGLAQ